MKGNHKYMMQLSFQVSIWSWVKEIQHSSPFSTEIENCTTEMQRGLSLLCTQISILVVAIKICDALRKPSPLLWHPLEVPSQDCRFGEHCLAPGVASQWLLFMSRPAVSFREDEYRSSLKPFWVFITSETKVTAPESGISMNDKKVVQL